MIKAISIRTNTPCTVKKGFNQINLVFSRSKTVPVDVKHQCVCVIVRTCRKSNVLILNLNVEKWKTFTRLFFFCECYIMLMFPYLGTLSESFEKRLKSIASNAYQQVNLKIVFSTTFRIADLFNIKDPIPKRLKSKLVYGIHYTDCDAVYVWKTKRRLSTRFTEHRDLKDPSHLTSTGHDALFDDVKILAYGKLTPNF